MSKQLHTLSRQAQWMRIRLHNKAVRVREIYRGEGIVEYLLVLTLIVGLVVLAAVQ